MKKQKSKKRRKKQEGKEKRKLKFSDHVLYCVVYIVLLALLVSYPIIGLLRDKIYFAPRFRLLAYANGYGLLWLFPILIVGGISLWYFNDAERQKLSMAIAWKGLTSTLKRRLLTISFISILVLSLLLSTFSGHFEMRKDGIYKRNVLQVSKKIVEIESVDKIEWLFESSTTTTIGVGYGFEHRLTLSCVVWSGEDKISFDRLKLYEIPTIIELFSNCTQIITNGESATRWVSEIDCDEQLRLFLQNYFNAASATQ